MEDTVASRYVCIAVILASGYVEPGLLPAIIFSYNSPFWPRNCNNASRRAFAATAAVRGCSAISVYLAARWFIAVPTKQPLNKSCFDAAFLTLATSSCGRQRHVAFKYRRAVERVQHHGGAHVRESIPLHWIKPSVGCSSLPLLQLHRKCGERKRQRRPVSA